MSHVWASYCSTPEGFHMPSCSSCIHSDQVKYFSCISLLITTPTPTHTSFYKKCVLLWIFSWGDFCLRGCADVMNDVLRGLWALAYFENRAPAFLVLFLLSVQLDTVSVRNRGAGLFIAKLWAETLRWTLTTSSCYNTGGLHDQILFVFTDHNKI